MITIQKKVKLGTCPPDSLSPDSLFPLQQYYNSDII